MGRRARVACLEAGGMSERVTPSDDGDDDGGGGDDDEADDCRVRVCLAAARAARQRERLGSDTSQTRARAIGRRRRVVWRVI